MFLLPTGGADLKWHAENLDLSTSHALIIFLLSHQFSITYKQGRQSMTPLPAERSDEVKGYLVGMKAAAVFCIGGLLLFSFPSSGEKGGPMALIVESSVFGHNHRIPSKYTCDGLNISPPIAWKNIPEGTKSIVLIADDPDAPAGIWVHWVCYDLPPPVVALPEGVQAADTLAQGGKQGRTDFGNVGYGGPCPPSGTHRYFFKVYALDCMLGLSPGKTKQEIERAMKGHILGQGELIGTYSRK
jgi:Raf kinase inhibitor-like YbhB/YbcL family protein